MIILENMTWMGWNVFLAGLGVLFAWVFRNTKHGFGQTLVFALWLLFVPNTIYLLTDLIHLPGQWTGAGMAERLVLAGQYGLIVYLGILTYLKSMGMLTQGVYRWTRNRRAALARVVRGRVPLLMLGLNYLIAFGVVMGRMMRTNSWYVVTDPGRVAADMWAVLVSAKMMAGVAMMFGLLQLLYLARASQAKLR